MPALSVGVVATSLKPDERRLAIHPAHVERIDPGLRARLYLEQGYGVQHDFADEHLADLVAGMRTREELCAECDIVLLPKPLAADLETLRPGQVVWGWPHCVQDRAITQLAIDRELTLIAFEAMNHWTRDGSFSLHVFHQNNELAGYCSILHALQLVGSTGAYGRRLNAAVISFGATGRGAVNGLTALGITDVSVLTQRSSAAVAAPVPSVRMRTLATEDEVLTVDDGSDTVPLVEFLARHDIVVNCILQDPDEPLVFVRDADLPAFKPSTLFVDVSCDEGMGFEWARPTSFAEPMLTVGDRLHYYAVDHTPSYLWNSATWENSEALLEYLPVVMGGPDAWEADDTIRRAIEIKDGRIRNEKILSFQGRSAEYPYSVAR